jgi:PcfJ-like protein
MPHRPAKRGSRTEAPPAPADAELMRHIRALGLESVEAYRAWCRERGFRAATQKSWQEQRQERLAARRAPAAAASTAELTGHIASLGLKDAAEYRAWCRQHGFSEGPRKSRQQRRQEQLAAERQKAEAMLASARRQTRRPEDTLQRISRGEIDAEMLGSPALRKIHEAFAGVPGQPEVREALLRLLRHVRKHGNLLGTEPAVQYLGREPGNSLIEGLLALARRHRDWLRPVEAWRPESHNTRRQFGSLARHLLANYFVPAFLDAAWFEGDSEKARQHQAWFRHIGIGQNIRTAGLPVTLTKRMAHCFLQAPDDYSIDAALRYGQILGLNGDEHLARAVISTRLSETDAHEAFWLTVLHFFVNNPMLDTACVGPIIDYVYHQKYVPRERENGRTELTRRHEDTEREERSWEESEGGERLAPGPRSPLQPEFSMKGRTAAALLRLVEEWHGQLARESRKRPAQWEASGIGGFRLLEASAEAGDGLCWIVEELLTDQAVREEGKAMNHCVASYARSCAKGHTSIWSLQVEDGRTGARRRAMTIAVQNARKLITQARGRCNRLPGAKHASLRLNRAPEILELWARQEGLILPKHL